MQYSLLVFSVMLGLFFVGIAEVLSGTIGTMAKIGE
jgi:hypothetical protein